MRTPLASLVALALLASAALAQDIIDVSPASGSIGTVVTITGTGFGTKKPSVFLTSPETGIKQAADGPDGRKVRLPTIGHIDPARTAKLAEGGRALKTFLHDNPVSFACETKAKGCNSGAPGFATADGVLHACPALTNLADPKRQAEQF